MLERRDNIVALICVSSVSLLVSCVLAIGVVKSPIGNLTECGQVSGGHQPGLMAHVNCSVSGRR